MKKILAILWIFLLLTGCSAKPMMTVDGFEVSQSLYRYYYQSAAAEYEGDTAASEARELLRAHVAVIRFAETYGISLSEDEEKEVDRQIQSAKNRNDDFAEMLSEQALTESLYRDLCLHDALRDKLMSHLHTDVYAVTEAQMRQIIEEEFVCARHIFFENTVDGAESAAQVAVEQLAQGADFDALFHEYMGEDYSTVANILTYCNPVALLIRDMRNVLLYQQAPSWIALGIWTVIAIVLSIIGVRTIYKNENSYVKVI